MMKKEKNNGNDVKIFPIKLDSDFSKEIDFCVLLTDSASKHQYILDAIRERVDRDSKK